MGRMELSWDVPIGTQDGKDSGIWATQWDKWDYPGMSQLSLGHRMGRTVGYGPPSGTNGIILGCPNCPWDTGWEGQWDLDHPVRQMGLSWDVPIVLGTQDGKNSGIWATQWDKWDCLEMSQLSLRKRMGRTVGFGPPSGTSGIVSRCPNCPWDTGWEGQWDLGHPVGQVGLS